MRWQTLLFGICYLDNNIISRIISFVNLFYKKIPLLSGFFLFFSRDKANICSPVMSKLLQKNHKKTVTYIAYGGRERAKAKTRKKQATDDGVQPKSVQNVLFCVLWE